MTKRGTIQIDFERVCFAWAAGRRLRTVLAVKTGPVGNRPDRRRGARILRPWSSEQDRSIIGM